MHVHLIVVTNYQRGVFTSEMLTHCEKIMRNVCQDFEADQYTGAPRRLARTSTVAVLLLRLLRRRAADDPPPTHRAATTSALTSRSEQSRDAVHSRPEGQGIHAR
ncbi:transposase [Streptomyces sp. RTd22]